MNTTYPKKCDVPRGWHLVDATGVVLGRMAVRIATILMGKHRPIYSAHIDTGEFIVVINAAKVKLTGTKADTRMVRYHTGWIGGLKERTAGKVLADKPAELITLAVRRMLPKTKLGRAMLKKMKVYAGAEHPHGAQQPKPLVLTAS
ncbi:MAG: 50S ribosomal protein L13 [Planctomycetes bacterium]|nr:50S ribosomal protein L13 [Planctomycetota bacterium]